MPEINEDQARDTYRTYKGILLGRQNYTSKLVERMIETDDKIDTKMAKAFFCIVQSCKANIETIINELDELLNTHPSKAAVLVANINHALHSHVELGSWVYPSWEMAEHTVSKKRQYQMHKAKRLSAFTGEQKARAAAIERALAELDWSTIGKRRGAHAVTSKIERQVNADLVGGGFDRMSDDAIARLVSKHPRFRGAP